MAVVAAAHDHLLLRMKPHCCQLAVCLCYCEGGWFSGGGGVLLPFFHAMEAGKRVFVADS